MRARRGPLGLIARYFLASSTISRWEACQEAFARDVEDYLVADGDAAWRLATRWARTGDSSGRGAATPFADPEVRPWVRRVCDGAGRSVAVDGIVMSVDHDNLPWHASDAVPCVSWDASDEVFFST